jgi:hypothetical protein
MKKSVIGYAQGPVKISKMPNAYPGVSVSLCSASWKRSMCHGTCCLLIRDGTFWRDKFLAKALKKSVSKLTWKDKTDRKEQLERAAFKRCRPITITISD